VAIGMAEIKKKRIREETSSSLCIIIMSLSTPELIAAFHVLRLKVTEQVSA
jgi:hypothetical protein